MTPATLTAAIHSSEANHATLVSRAASLAGKPAEHDAWADARAAHRITVNLRQLLETCPKGTP
jgi:hypothetical protein